jgi:hypothetical protein
MDFLYDYLNILGLFVAMPNTAANLVVKAFAIIAIGFAGRGIECFDMDWEKILRTTMDDGSHRYIIHFARAKQTGPSSGMESMPIVGLDEVAILDEYVTCFLLEKRHGRFFRKLKGITKIESTEQVIGKSTTAKYGKIIAGQLGLKDSEGYTGHTWRRTAITWAADSGLSLPQIKILSGHKSDTAVQGYIDRSVPMQNLVSSAVTVNPVQSTSTISRLNRSLYHSQQITSESSSSSLALRPTDTEDEQPLKKHRSSPSFPEYFNSY